MAILRRNNAKAWVSIVYTRITYFELIVFYKMRKSFSRAYRFVFGAKVHYNTQFYRTVGRFSAPKRIKNKLKKKRRKNRKRETIENTESDHLIAVITSALCPLASAVILSKRTKPRGWEDQSLEEGNWGVIKKEEKKKWIKGSTRSEVEGEWRRVCIHVCSIREKREYR